MHKYRLVILLLFLGTGTLYAQNDVKWSVGVFGGVSNNHLDIDTWYASDIKYSDESGYTFGVTGSYHFTRWLSLRADVAMVQKNWRMDRDNQYVSFIYTDAKNNYLSVPVMAVVSVGRTVRLCGLFGGYAGYWMLGHREGESLSVTYLITGNEETNHYDEDYEFNSDHDNRFDAGLVYGAELRCLIKKKIDVSLAVRWYYGMTDTQKDYMRVSNPRYNTTRTIQLGVAYCF